MTVCRVIAITFGVAYLIALALFAIGILGLFGQERDPLAGVFLVPLGLPWNRFLDWIPEALLTWAATAAPAINLVILWLLCRTFGSSRQLKSGGDS